jgi:hypothetical protein
VGSKFEGRDEQAVRRVGRGGRAAGRERGRVRVGNECLTLLGVAERVSVGVSVCGCESCSFSRGSWSCRQETGRRVVALALERQDTAPTRPRAGPARKSGGSSPRRSSQDASTRRHLRLLDSPGTTASPLTQQPTQPITHCRHL